MSTPPENLHAEKPALAWPYSLRLLVGALWLLIGVVAFMLARPMWWLIALALIVGYLVQPFVKALTRLRIPRGLATLLAILLLLLLLILAPVILVVALTNSIGQISIDVQDLSTYINSIADYVQRLPQILPAVTLLGYTIDLRPYYAQIENTVTNIQPSDLLTLAQNLIGVVANLLRSAFQVVGFATAIATNVIGRTVGVLISLVFLVLLSFYITNSLPRARSAMLDLAPEAYRPEWQELWRRTGVIWSGFFRGQLLLSVIMGTLVGGVLALMGIPGALALGILSGVLEVIPTLGPVLAAIPGILLALLQGSTYFPEVPNYVVALIVLGFYIVAQQIENLFLVPRILGRSVGVHPALILVAVAIFTIQFGIFGAFVATPVLATLLAWFAYFHARMIGREPYPELATLPQHHDPAPELSPPRHAEHEEKITTAAILDAIDS